VIDTGDVYKYVTEGISDFNQFIYDINKFLNQEQN